MPYSDTLRNEVTATDRRLGELRGSLATSRRALEQLHDLQRYMQTKSDEFGNRHDACRNSFRTLQFSDIHSKALTGYNTVMDGILNGNQANYLYGEYEEALNQISNGIRRAEEEIADFSHSIASAQQCRAEQVRHLNRVVAEEQWEADQDRKKMEARRRGEW